MGYTSYRGVTGNCTIRKDTSPHEDDDDPRTAPLLLRGSYPFPSYGGGTTFGGGIEGGVASISGYASVPSNDYAVLMNAVAKAGPVAVAVAASAWGPYEGGVYSADMSLGGPYTDMNHLVVIVGYGTDDEDSGKDYWLVRNSWSPRWGEGGYIRLERADPSSPDYDASRDCGWDDSPLHGIACETDEDGRPVDNDPPLVCGTSGVTYDGVLPVGGYLL